jgi:hypothetical protein
MDWHRGHLNITHKVEYVFSLFSILIILLGANAFSLRAQSEKVFTVQAELSSSLINNIFQDRNKIIWKTD